MNRFAFFLCASLLFVAMSGIGNMRPGAAAAARPLDLAVLDLGATPTGRQVADQLSRNLKASGDFRVVDAAQSRAAQQGIGYTGSLNMTLNDARDLGRAIGCDFYIIGDAQTLRRSSSAKAIYYEAYASLFVVSSRSGRLIHWERLSTEAASLAQAEAGLRIELDAFGQKAQSIIHKAEHDDEQQQQRAREAAAPERGKTVAAGAVDAGETNSKDYEPPQPFRRLQPPYPQSAAQSEVEATVDALVEIDEQGRVGAVEIVRWAGYGLDEAVVATVKGLNFRPAMQAKVPVPAQVLLRYNFRRPTTVSLLQGFLWFFRKFNANLRP